MSSSSTKKAAKIQADEIRAQTALQKQAMLDQAQAANAAQVNADALRVAKDNAAAAEKAAAAGATDTADVALGGTQSDDLMAIAKRRNKFFSPNTSGANL